MKKTLHILEVFELGKQNAFCASMLWFSHPPPIGCGPVTDLQIHHVSPHVYSLPPLPSLSSVTTSYCNVGLRIVLVRSIDDALTRFLH